MGGVLSPYGPFSTWQPSDDGYLGFNSDPAYASGGGLLIAGTAYLARMEIRAPTLITNLSVCVTAIGGGTANGFSGLWIVAGPGAVNAGAVLAQTADQTATFTGTTGWKLIPLVTPTVIGGPPFPYAVLLSNLLTTQVTTLRQLNTVNNAPQASANVSALRWAQQPAFGGSVGAVTLASNAGSGFSNIVGWS